MADEDSKPSYDVFISYARSDSKWTERLAKELNQTGLRCWVDKDELKAGEEWEERLRKALETVRVCLIVLGDASDPSKPGISKEWSAVQEGLWRRRDLSLCSVNLKDSEPPPFLRKWHSLRIDKSSARWDEIVANTSKLLEASQAETPGESPKGELAVTAERFAELLQAIQAAKQTEEKSDDE